MAIDFPNSPAVGNTYTFLNVTYTFLQPDPLFDGYWAVVNPASLGPATTGEINAGTTNDKYNTPLGLAGSKYVREDEATGETVLKHSGVDRVKTTAQGTELTGKLDINNQGNMEIYVVESGLNSDGEFRVWSDGTIENWGLIVATTTSSGFVTYLQNFPKPFTTSCRRAIVGKADNGDDDFGAFHQENQTTLATMAIRMLRPRTSATAGTYYAIGS